MVSLIVPVAIAGSIFGLSGKDDFCDLVPKAREFKSAQYYTGPLLDAHMHMPVSSWIVSAVGKRIGFPGMTSFGGKLNIDYLSCIQKSEGIVKTIGFFMPTKFSRGAEISTVKKVEEKHPGEFAPFLMPAPFSSLRISLKDVRNTLDKNKNLFQGIGEIKVMDGTTLDNPYFLEMFKIADEYNLLVMMHPFPDDKELVKKILKQYPKVKFLIHGGHDSEWITEVMSERSNAYYSLDANIAALYGWDRKHNSKEPSREEWLAYIRENFDSLLDEELRFWKPRVEAYPDRFMWGTDRWYAWHFDQEVGGVLEEIGRSFIGRLSPSVQEKFAYKNAERFLKK
ncbi:MAG: Uncharacterized protein G01um101419_82 [Parcubacteria group bacterium Gr01-1014_19]|nr:MAG: Uncharacterized protein G01um101419_82 [Parcubacteria group bacterium Gr01-1014_19]